MRRHLPPSFFVSLLSFAWSFTAWAAVPVARDDASHAIDGQAVTIDVLANDTVDDPTKIILAVTSLPATGTAVVTDGKIIYTPANTATGDDTFTYSITDLSGTASATVRLRNVAPTALKDTFRLSSTAGGTISPLRNDRDPDGDFIRITALTQGNAGVVTHNDSEIFYHPGPNFRGVDRFTYTISDYYGLTATAQVTVVSPQQIAGGLETALAVVDANGKTQGFLQLDVAAGGAFSGKLRLDGQKYVLNGALDSRGSFLGLARNDDGKAVQVRLQVAFAADGSATLNASLPDGLSAQQAISTLTANDRAAAKGRYTVLLPASGRDATSTDGANDGAEPHGTGWMTIKVGSSGRVSIKGQAGDGRKFSGESVLGGNASSPEVIVFTTPKSTILTGTLSLGDSVTGDLAWSRGQTSADFYPEGFDLTIAAAGARWVAPATGSRVLAKNATLTVDGGDVPEFEREIRDTKKNDLKVDFGDENLEFSIDRKTGIFKGSFKNTDDENQHIRINGVIVQSAAGDPVGGGVFQGNHKAGRVVVEAGTTTKTTGNTDTDTATQTDTGGSDTGTDTDTSTDTPIDTSTDPVDLSPILDQ